MLIIMPSVTTKKVIFKSSKRNDKTIKMAYYEISTQKKVNEGIERQKDIRYIGKIAKQ